MAFHVFVEGPTDGTAAGVARLADAIAKHYGLPAADLLARLQKGRFRVKGNTDRATAEQYCRDLQRLGARCVIEEANADNSQRSTPLPFPAVRPATPPAGLPVASALPAAPSRPTPPSALPAATPRPATPPAGSQAYQSGLSAAFSANDAPAANLGALEQENFSFSLSSVDGAEGKAENPAAFAPPEGLSASIGPAPDKPKAAKADKPKDVPLDLFAPPDAQDAELAVDIASDEPPRRRSEPVIAAQAEPPSHKSEPVMRKSEPALRKSQPSVSVPADAAAAAVASSSSKLGPLADTRVRFAAGVLLAILIGFVPAHLFAAMREGSAYKAIDNKVMAAQQMADTPDAYAQLDRMRADQLARKQGEQRNTAIIALAIWGLVGGAVAFAWFKKVPWERFE